MYKLATLKDLQEYNNENNMDETLYNVNILKYSNIGEYEGSNSLFKTNDYKKALEQYHAFKYYHAGNCCKIELTRAVLYRDSVDPGIEYIYERPRYTFATPKLKYVLGNR